MEINVRNLLLGIQLTVITVTAIILVGDFSADFDTKKVETFGGTLTLVMLFVGAYCHKQAATGVILFPPLLLIAGIPSAYAWLGGELRHVITYHFVVLGIYGFVWWNFEKVRKATLAKAAAETSPEQEPEQDNPS